jgi:hypothetical protein
MPLKQSRGLDGPFIFASANFAIYARIHAAGNISLNSLLYNTYSAYPFRLTGQQCP